MNNIFRDIKKEYIVFKNEDNSETCKHKIFKNQYNKISCMWTSRIRNINIKQASSHSTIYHIKNISYSLHGKCKNKMMALTYHTQFNNSNHGPFHRYKMSNISQTILPPTIEDQSLFSFPSAINMKDISMLT